MGRSAEDEPAVVLDEVCNHGDLFCLCFVAVDCEMMGVPPSGSGLRPNVLSQSALSQAEPLVPNAGQWGIFRSYRIPEVRQIAKVTPTLVKLEGTNWPRQKSRTDIIACLDDKEAAMKLAQSLSGAAGQREKRIKKAQEDFAERKASAWAEYERTEAKLVASAIEARSDVTHASLGCTVANCFICQREAGGTAEGESAVPNGETPDA